MTGPSAVSAHFRSLFAGVENAGHENARNDEYGKPIILKYIFLNHSFTPLGFFKQ